MIEGFAKEMKLGTKESHSMAESTSFVKKFLGGVVEEENYRTLVANFYFVYRALEEQIDRNSDDPIIAPLAKMTELKRVPALEKDLAYFYGGSWFLDVDPSDACKTYIDRILHCNMEELVGHHYTRYLGDLSGGQILKTIAEKALNLPKNEGLHFYDFPKIDDKKEFNDTCAADNPHARLVARLLPAPTARICYSHTAHYYLAHPHRGSQLR